LRLPRDGFTDEIRRVLLSSDAHTLRASVDNNSTPPSFEPAGPRPKVFFDVESLGCGIVTCGGLCPGLNDVIRSLVLTLKYQYGVTRILGFRYGFSGLSSRRPAEPLELTTATVDTIHEQGGTILGTSRGPQKVAEMVDALLHSKIGILFAIGGDGTLRGASAIARESARRDVPIAVVGIPKTIDNDLQWIERSFGFSTAVEEARRAIRAAHCEARGAWNGVGLVKLMGRHSGFIAGHATLANSDVNFCMVPEVPFQIEGSGGFLAVLERRLGDKHHAVVVLAEGAGQDLLTDRTSLADDASGNVRLQDIGGFLRERITQHFAERGKEITVKYIDPSYTIRSLPANSSDSEFCLILGQHAVHAAMAGRTDVLIGCWNQHFTHVPIPLAVRKRKRLDPKGGTWQRVLEATGQPAMSSRSASSSEEKGVLE
jgi:6-phosphofructokinase 1